MVYGYSFLVILEFTLLRSRIFDRLVNHIQPSTSNYIVIRIEPLARLAHEAADFMQTMRTAAHFVACHEFHYCMIRLKLFMPPHFQPEPFAERFARQRK